jgi:peroxiredoxin
MQGYVAANRAVLVLDKNGVVRYKWVAPSPGTEPNYDEVREAVSKLG